MPGTAKPATEASYGNVVRRHLIPTLGKVPLRKLTPGHVRRLLREKSQESNGRDGTLSPRMVQYIHAVLRRVLEQARRDELVDRNVAALVQPPRAPRQEYRWLTEEEAGRLVAAVREDRLYAVYALALGLGLRRGEVLGLRWIDVDLDAQVVAVRRSLQRLAASSCSWSRRPSAPIGRCRCPVCAWMRCASTASVKTKSAPARRLAG